MSVRFIKEAKSTFNNCFIVNDLKSITFTVLENHFTSFFSGTKEVQNGSKWIKSFSDSLFNPLNMVKNQKKTIYQMQPPFFPARYLKFYI